MSAEMFGGAAESEKDQRLREFLARHGCAEPTSGMHLKAVLDQAAVTVTAALARAGVDVLVLKGPGLEALLYADGEQRRYVDVDLLVSPGDLERAAEVLETLGYQNAGRHLGIDDVGGVVHAETWIRLESGALTPQIELHRWFPGAAGPPDEVWAALWTTRTRIAVGDGEVWVLDLEGQALQLAMHLAQHGPGYVRGAWELRLALARWPAEIWQKAAILGRRIRALEPFATGLRLVNAPASLMDELDLPSATNTAWDAEHREEFPRGIYFLEAILEARGAARLHILRRALVPSPRWIAFNYRLNEPSRLELAVAYARHLLRAPVWAVRAALFSRRRRRAVRH